MKKFGFTIQELLITLGIIGIVAAMTAPVIVKIVPDDTKLKYLKTYNTLTTLTNDILGDNTLYWTQGYQANGAPNCVGLACTSSAPDQFRALITAHPEFQNTLNRTRASYHDDNDEVQNVNNIDENSWRNISDAKFGLLLASKMNLETNPGVTSNIDGGRDCSFTTTDGTVWFVSYAPSVSADTDITVDINNDDGFVHHTFEEAVNNEEDVNQVVRFTFAVTPEGAVRATDALGRAFLQDPSNMHNKRGDRDTARRLMAN